MHLNNTPFEEIKSKQKTVEIRFKSKEEIVMRGVLYWPDEIQNKYGFLAIYLEVQQ